MSDPAAQQAAVDLIAFYLPQFHPIPQNDAWWGKGFTEWRNVVQARPQFEGHDQPQLPADLGFYDLRLPQVRQAQAELARAYGVQAFCYYYYWFAGQRLLEQPLEQMLAGEAPDLPFCLCWANENWSRRWDGNERETLIAQQHSPEDDLAVWADLSRYFADPRYYRIDGRPLLLLYRVDLLPDAAATAARWKAAARASGQPEPYLCAVQSFGVSDPRPYGFDAAVEFPPHGMVAGEFSKRELAARPDFKGRIFSYPQIVGHALAKPETDYPRFRGVMPSWDNTARRKAFGHVYHGATPALYRGWLAEMMRRAAQDARLPRPIVFINAWNEWAEGCHLEPDLRHGHAWLQATLAARQHGALPADELEALRQGSAMQQGEVAGPWQLVASASPQARAGNSLYLWLRLRINRYPGLKTRLKPLARWLGLIE